MGEFLGGFGSGFRTNVQHNFNIKGIGIQAAKTLFFRFQKDKELEKELRDAADGEGVLGTLVYDELVIKGGNFFEQDDIQQENPIPYEGLKIHAVLIEVNQSKNIVTTSLQGRNGTVKEYVSDGDFAITLTGFITGENFGPDMETRAEEAVIRDLGNFYPEVDVQRMITILKVPDSITLISNFLSQFDISDSVVMNYSIPQREATRDMQPFQINLLSDTPINLLDLNELEI